MLRLPLLAALAIVALLSPVTRTQAVEINTGGETGAYHTDFCPALIKQLITLGTGGNCVTSRGTAENMRRVARNPQEFGFAQLDVFAHERETFGRDAFEIVRSDDVRECVFAVTRSRQLTNFGEIAVNADRLRFVLPPEASGSAKTFSFLRQIDPEGLGQANNVMHASSVDEALNIALSDENSVSFFVQFPDPANERFRLIRQLNGHILPVIDSIILRQKVDGQPIYFPQETSISQLRMVGLGAKVVTVCTPLILFTGNSRNIDPGEPRREHRQLVLNIRGLRTSDLIPETSPFAKLLTTTRQLSNQAQQHFQSLSQDARERAKPFMERVYRGAQEIVRIMIIKARPPDYVR